jgi:ribosomal protein S18 acetylase RimI-like enzyme
VQGDKKFCYSLEIGFETRVQNTLIFTGKMSEFEDITFFNSNAIQRVTSKEQNIHQNLSLRPTESADEAFLETLYADTRREELAVFNWSREQENAFFKMQFEMQTRAYRMQSPDAAYYIVELGATPVGRLIVERREREIKLIDISLLSEFRNRGIGAFLLENLKAEAAASEKTVFLLVLKTNESAKRFYERLGFTVVEEADLYFAMRWHC